MSPTDRTPDKVSLARAMGKSHPGSTHRERVEQG